MRRKRKTPASAGLREKQESKREKHTASCADAMDGKDVSSVPDGTVAVEKRIVTSSGASPQTTGVTMTGKIGECAARSDGSQPQRGNPALPMVGNHAESGVVCKRTKGRKRRKARGDVPSNKLPGESCRSTLQVANDLVLETAAMDSKSKNSLVDKEHGVSRSADADPDGKLRSPEMHCREKKPINAYVKVDVPSRSADNSPRKNNGEEIIDTDTHPLVDKEDAGLTKGVDIVSVKSSSVGCAINSSSHDVKNGTSKKNKKGTKEGGSKYVCSNTFQENVDKLPFQVVQNCTSVISSSSLKTTDADKNDNQAPISDSLVLPAKEEGLLESVDAEIEKKSNMSPGINLNSNELISTSSKKNKKRRKNKNKNKNACTNSVTCPSDPTSANIPSMPEMAVNSFQVEDPGSIQTKTAKKETDKSSNCCICPSPIRGVVDDFASMDVSNKQSDQLDSFKADEVSFSFPIALKVSMDKSSASHSKKACQSGSGVGSQNGSPTVHTENALDNISTCTQSEMVDVLGKKEMASSSASHILEFALSSDVSKSEDQKLEAKNVLPERALISSTRKKMLVLDLNGLLADIILDFRNVHKAHTKVGGKSVFKRPFCDDFLKFCFERFDIGVWSSRKKYNVEGVVDYLMGDAKHKLLFCWDQSRCTVTGFRTVENVHKPLVLKELKKLWNKEETDLPWEKGEYSPSNTLLVDDSPYKALCNPPHTAIFPRPYNFSDEKDSSLGPGGDLRVYLEGLAMADDVQQYVHGHPFGQRAITATNPSWNFYLQVIDRVENTPASTGWR